MVKIPAAIPRRHLSAWPNPQPQLINITLTMCEGPSSISGPIPPDPSVFPQYYKHPVSARGRLEGNHPGTLALLSGPVPPDPVMHPGCYSACTPAQRPRIGPNATHILQRGQQGIVGELLKLNSAVFTPVPKQKQRVHDYGKENVRLLREIQRRCKEQEAERAQCHPGPVKALWTSAKYQNVPSRVMVQLQVTSPAIKPQCHNFLRAHSKGVSTAPLRPDPTTSSHVSQCTASCNQNLKLQVQGQSIDFIKHNAQAVGQTVLRRSQSLTSLRDKPVPSAVKGQVPQYLKERKKQWLKEEEERKRNAPDPTAPAGHTLMPENERKETLHSLKESHRSLMTELLSLPLKSDTLGVRSRRAYLDCRLSETEEAIKIFSRDKVYVKTDF